MRISREDPHPQAEQDWSDRIPDPEEDDDAPSPYEPTYRDGALKNECWREG